MIRPVNKNDAHTLACIYNHYVLHTHITFEEEAITDAEMERRIAELSHAFPYLVYEKANTVIGFAFASPWKSRCAYKYSVETSIYLEPTLGNKGIGTQLYEALLNKLPPLGLHAAIGGIALPNEASIRLHEKLGFKKVGQFEEVGFKFDSYIDVGYWEKMLS
jgi:phosphinothricin acetyltransferase